MKTFELFLTTGHFEIWLASLQSAGSIVTGVETPCEVVLSQKLVPNLDLSMTSLDPSQNLLRSLVNRGDFHDALRSQSWLPGLLAVAHKLPIPFSLATASQQKHGFPLIYVNPAFEKLTGYCQSDISGLNCEFLQCNNASMRLNLAEYGVYNFWAVACMKEALASGSPSKCRLKNFKKMVLHFVMN